eukprot:scaffold4316_cov116-Isochrysis_galbana.AAC.5
MFFNLRLLGCMRATLSLAPLYSLCISLCSSPRTESASPNVLLFPFAHTFRRTKIRTVIYRRLYPTACQRRLKKSSVTLYLYSSERSSVGIASRRSLGAGDCKTEDSGLGSKDGRARGRTDGRGLVMGRTESCLKAAPSHERARADARAASRLPPLGELMVVVARVLAVDVHQRRPYGERRHAGQ